MKKSHAQSPRDPSAKGEGLKPYEPDRLKHYSAQRKELAKALHDKERANRKIKEIIDSLGICIFQGGTNMSYEDLLAELEKALIDK